MKICSFAGVVGVRRNERREISQSNGNMNFLTGISIAGAWLAQISIRDLHMTYLLILMMTEALTSV